MLEAIFADVADVHFQCRKRHAWDRDRIPYTQGRRTKDRPRL